MTRKQTTLGLGRLLCSLLMMLPSATSTITDGHTTGTVMDTDGYEVIGATVMVVGEPGLGAATNLDGEFTINNVPSNATIRVSYVGYVTQDIDLADVHILMWY